MRWQDQSLYRFGVEEEDAGPGGDHDQEGDQDGQHHLPPGLPLVQVSDGEARLRAGIKKFINLSWLSVLPLTGRSDS